MKIKNSNNKISHFGLFVAVLWYFISSFLSYLKGIFTLIQNLKFGFDLVLVWLGLWKEFLCWFWLVVEFKILGFGGWFILFSPRNLFLMLSSAAEISLLFSWYHFFPWASSHYLWIRMGNRHGWGLFETMFWLGGILATEIALLSCPGLLVKIVTFPIWIPRERFVLLFDDCTEKIWFEG